MIYLPIFGGFNLTEELIQEITGNFERITIKIHMQSFHLIDIGIGKE